MYRFSIFTKLVTQYDHESTVHYLKLIKNNLQFTTPYKDDTAKSQN